MLDEAEEKASEILHKDKDGAHPSPAVTPEGADLVTDSSTDV